MIEGKKDKFNLYTISIPVKRSQKPQPCYLTLWDSESFRSKGNQETGTEVLSSLALRYSQNCPNIELKLRLGSMEIKERERDLFFHFIYDQEERILKEKRDKKIKDRIKIQLT